jgi:hypothetical protein
MSTDIRTETLIRDIETLKHKNQMLTMDKQISELVAQQALLYEKTRALSLDNAGVQASLDGLERDIRALRSRFDRVASMMDEYEGGACVSMERAKYMMVEARMERDSSVNYTMINAVAELVNEVPNAASDLSALFDGKHIKTDAYLKLIALLDPVSVWVQMRRKLGVFDVKKMAKAVRDLEDGGKWRKIMIEVVTEGARGGLVGIRSNEADKNNIKDVLARADTILALAEYATVVTDTIVAVELCVPEAKLVMPKRGDPFNPERHENSNPEHELNVVRVRRPGLMCKTDGANLVHALVDTRVVDKTPKYSFDGEDALAF